MISAPSLSTTSNSNHYPKFFNSLKEFFRSSISPTVSLPTIAATNGEKTYAQAVISNQRVLPASSKIRNLYSVPKRIEQIKLKKLCFGCGMAKYVAKDCRNSVLYFYFNGLGA